MLTLLVLAVVASASAIPLGEKKVLPIYEYPHVSETIDEGAIRRSWCVDDCHHHVIDKPVFVMSKGQDGKSILQFHPLGLNSIAKSPLRDVLMSGKMVAMISPLAKIPHGLLPEFSFETPAHTYKLSDFYKEAPVMLVVTDEEFKELTKAPTPYTHLADLAVDETGFSMLEEYSLPVVSKSWFWENPGFIKGMMSAYGGVHG